MIEDSAALTETANTLRPGVRRSQRHVQRVLAHILAKAHDNAAPWHAEEDQSRDCYGIPRPDSDE